MDNDENGGLSAIHWISIIAMMTGLYLWKHGWPAHF